MPSYKVNVIRNAGRPSRYEEALKGWAMDVIQWVQNYMIDNDRIATTKSISSFEIIIENNDITIYAADSVGYALQGRKAGAFPNITDLKEWVLAKPIEPYPDQNGRIPTINQLVYLIGRKIEKKGTNPPKLVPQNLTAVVASKGLPYQERISEEYSAAILEDFTSVFKRSRVYKK